MTGGRAAGLGVFLVMLVAGLAGCHSDHRQSALHPASRAASEIATLWWVMFGLLAVSFLVVMALTFVAVVRRRHPADTPEAARRRTGWLVYGGGMVFPGVVLLGLLFYSLGTSQSLRRPAEGLRIEVTGHQWWWEVRYPEAGIITANELHLPAGEPVVIELRAADVIHSFWVPNLHGKIDLLPEVPTRIVLEAGQPGEWRGQCAEFCGRQHAWMGILVVATPRVEFDAWVRDRQATTRPDPAEEVHQRGEAVFARESCHTCHALGDSIAPGRIGPDLTHLGSRRTLGAGRFAHTPENLARWLRDPQEIKPGSLMPATPLDDDDLAALVAYLQAWR